MVRRSASPLLPRTSGCGRFGVRGCRSKSFPQRIFTEADQVRKNPVGAGNAVRHLAIECVRVVDIDALSVVRIDQSALLKRLPGIMSLDERFIGGVPTRKELGAAVFHPLL